jgi:cytosine/adenosine deaminase-related metal-dependent hydrolase
VTSLLLDLCRAVVTMDDRGTELRDASILIEDGWIRYVGSDPPGTRPNDNVETADCRRFIAIPGLVNTHHHLYQTLTRAFPESEGRGLFAWLQMLYPIWAGLTTEMIYASTRAGLAELALSGCTTTSDHLYVFPEGSSDFIDAQVEAARSVGLRFHVTRGSMDLGESRGGLPPDSVIQPLDVIMRDSERVVDAYHDRSEGAMVRVGLAPCSPFSVTPELMRASAELARDRGVRLHTHIAETTDEDSFSREKFGLSPVALLDSLGWLGTDVWLAHCVHPTDHDIGLLASSHASVAHCPTSNMLLGSGLAPVRRLIDSGVGVGLGVDGSASNDSNDLRGEVKQAVLAARLRDGPEALSAREALRMATRGGAECLGRDDIGSLEAGKAADILLFDLDDLALAGAGEDWVAALVLCAAHPHTTYVHGKPVIRARDPVNFDVEAIARAQRDSSESLLKRWRGTR